MITQVKVKLILLYETLEHEMIMVFERLGGGKTSTTSPFSDK